MEIFEYAFMRKAFYVGTLLSFIIPCIGIVVILRRLSMIGDALSHSSLAGVAGGLILGINPVLGAIVLSVLASLSIEFIRKKIPRYAELSIAVVMSASVGLTGVFSSFVKNAANFNSFLFGSIVAISNMEVIFVTIITLTVFIIFCLLYKELFHIAFDEQSARLAGIPVNAITFIFTVLTGLTVSISSRTVGALIVSSMMVLPGACAMEFADSYLKTVVYSVIFAVFFNITGLFLAYYMKLRPGGTIVLVATFTLLLIFLFKKIKK